MAHSLLLRVAIAGMAAASALAPSIASAAVPGPLVYPNGNGELVVQSPAAGSPTKVIGTDRRTFVRPDVSPDGRWVLSVDTQDRVVRSSLDGTGAPEVMATMPEGYSSPESPVWRPDGRAFAYLRLVRADGTNELVVESLDGTAKTVHPLPGRTRRISWNPDGSELALAWQTYSPFETRYRLSLIDVASGVTAPLRPQDLDPEGFISDEDPVFSPDGRSIAFRQYRYDPETTSATRFIRTMPVETGGLPDRVLLSSQEYLAGPTFSPDGQRLVWTASTNRTGEGTPGTDLVVADADGGERTVLQRTFAPDSPGPIAWASGAAPSAEGRVLFYRGGNVMRIDPGGEPVVVTSGTEPAISADGTRIAYIAGSDSGTDVFTSTPTGKDVRQVTRNTPSEHDPALSPDGTRVVFSRPDEYGAWNLWVANADGTGGEVQISLTAGRDIDPAFSPDGKQVAYASSGRSGDPDIRVVDVDGRNQIMWRKTGRHPVFSPDGTQLLFTGVQGYRAQIYLSTPGIGTGVRAVTSDSAGARHPGWSPDGGSFVYESDQGGLFKAFADGTGVTRLTSSSDHDPVWGPVPAPPKVTMTPAEVTEGRPAPITFTLARPSDEPAVFRVRTVEGTATARDFTPVDQTVTIAPGETTASLAVQTTDDAMDEPDEALTLAVTAIEGVTAGPPVTVKILDDDAPPALSVTDVDMAEGDLGFTDAVFTLRLSAESGWTVKARAATVDGTAAAPDDFTATAAALAFAPGETEKTVRVPIFGDTQAEADEAFTLALDGLEHVTGPTRAARATLRNDDTDGELPDTRVETGPDGLVNLAAPTFTFIGSVPRGAFECRVDAGAWAPCTTPHRIRTVVDGTHTFEVRALDGGLVDP
jgi:Tol biopolymer transport system component